jgi:hypothetical protein
MNCTCSASADTMTPTPDESSTRPLGYQLQPRRQLGSKHATIDEMKHRRHHQGEALFSSGSHWDWENSEESEDNSELLLLPMLQEELPTFPDEFPKPAFVIRPRTLSEDDMTDFGMSPRFALDPADTYTTVGTDDESNGALYWNPSDCSAFTTPKMVIARAFASPPPLVRRAVSPFSMQYHGSGSYQSPKLLMPMTP